MPNVEDEILRVIEALADPDGRALRFIAIFARFEYALKRCRFLKKRSARTYRAEPDWDGFAQSIGGRFKTVTAPAFHQACATLEARPPQQQCVSGGTLQWRKPTSRKNSETVEEYTLRLVRIVRNNLFHGGKYPMIGQVQDAARDRSLIDACIAILLECLSLSHSVRGTFADPG